MLFTPNIYISSTVETQYEEIWYIKIPDITNKFPWSQWINFLCFVLFNFIDYWYNKISDITTLAWMTFLIAPKRKIVIFLYWKSSYVLCISQCTLSLPDLGNCYFLVFQNACSNLTYTCPGQSGTCLCSTLQQQTTYHEAFYHMFS